MSHPGLFAETPPYALDEAIQSNLDRLLGMIEQADMFAVIAIRTGPGRSEFGFWVEDDDGEYSAYLNDAIWEDATARRAWAEMWRHMAARYGDHPIVAGYDLMVEPNAGPHLFDIWDPEEFHESLSGTTFDWNTLYPDVVKAIREVDSDTPILIGAQGFSAVEWLPYLTPTSDDRTVYMVHQYDPAEYTHAEPPGAIVYPSPDDGFDIESLDDVLSAIDDFVELTGAPVGVNEFGVIRTQPGAAQYLDDLMSLFEERGLGYAIWDWAPIWEPFTTEVNEFNFSFGADPNSHADVDPNALLDVVKRYWALNELRPSTFSTASP